MVPPVLLLPSQSEQTGSGLAYILGQERTRRMEPDIRLDTVWSYSYTVSTVYNYLLKLPVDNRIEHGVYDGKKLCNA